MQISVCNSDQQLLCSKKVVWVNQAINTHIIATYIH